MQKICFGSAIVWIAAATSAHAETSWRLGTFVESPTHSFVIATEAGESNLDANAQRVQYNPTYSPNVGMRLGYKDAELSYSRKIKSSADPEIYGTSTYEDFHSTWTLTRWLRVGGFYQNYQSFYTDLNGHEGLKSSFESDDGTYQPPDSEGPMQKVFSDPIVKREDIGIEWAGGSAAFHLPVMAIMNEMETDPSKRVPDNIRIDGVLIVKWSQLALAGASSLVPEQLQETLASAANLKEITAQTTAVGVGIDSEIVGETFNFRFGGNGGAGSQNQLRKNIDGSKQQKTGSQINFLDMQLGFGFDLGPHKFGFDFLVDTLSSKVDGIKLTSNRLGAMASYDLEI